MSVEIRSYQPGDEAEQAALYNKLAAELPGFKPATSEDVRRRTREPDFDPESRFCAVDNGMVVGYISIADGGRVGFPWCLPEHRDAGGVLLNAALASLKKKGVKTAFAAYRADWKPVVAFFEANGFPKAREMVNFAQNMLDLPTLVISRGLNVKPLTAADIPAIVEMGQGIIRVPADQLEKHLLANPYFPPESVYVLRKSDGTPHGVGIVVANDGYAHPQKIDPNSPCFRLGAFGTEGLTWKRVNGMFSFIARNDKDFISVGLDLLSWAVNNMATDTMEVIAAQAPSDAPHMLGFYQRSFRKQGSFPVFERNLE